MGTSESESDTDADRQNSDRPQHQVKISKPFYMSSHEITQKQYKSITGENPSGAKGKNLLVEEVSWLDIQQFMIKLNERVGCSSPDTLKLVDESGVGAVTSGCFRLPSEAKWEYAARAGTNTDYSFGDKINPKIENYNGSSTKGLYRAKSIEVGSFQPNDFGLYDMHGNVWEWCQDYGAYQYLDKVLTVDPVLVQKQNRRVVRGGGWSDAAYFLRSAHRFSYDLDARDNSIGFRIVGVL